MSAVTMLSPIAAPEDAPELGLKLAPKRRVEGDDAVSVLRRLRALSRISGRLPAIADEEALLREVVVGLCRYFNRACHVRIYLSDADNSDTTTGYSLGKSGKIKALRCAGLDALAPMHRDLFLAPLRLPSHQPRRGTILTAPMLEGTSLLGLLLVEGAPDLELGQLELDTLTGIAAQTAMAVQHVRSTGILHEHKKLAQDFEAARRIQQSFLPQVAERVGAFRIATHYQPAFHVGGDFYDVLPLDDDRLLATIGDVSGKGVSGALLMARVTAELRRITMFEREPSRILGELDRSLAAQIADDTFVTAACARLDARCGMVKLANAGHVLPLLRRRSGDVLTFGIPSGPPLAMVNGQVWTDEIVQLEPGDILLLMTDGILDALHSEEDPLGLSALEMLVRRMPPDIFDIRDRILAEVAERARKATQRASAQGIPGIDDITFLAIEYVETC